MPVHGVHREKRHPERVRPAGHERPAERAKGGEELRPGPGKAGVEAEVPAVVESVTHLPAKVPVGRLASNETEHKETA